MIRMTKTYMEAREAQEKRLMVEDRKGSTGSNGKRGEVRVRHYTLKKGLKSVQDGKAHSAGKPDVKLMGADGKYYTLEVKTGRGAVAYREASEEPFTKEDMTAENIVPNADFVAWDTMPTLTTEENFAKRFFVFSREEFLEVLLKMFQKSGDFTSALSVTKNGYQLNIQPISAKPERMFYEYIEEHNTPCLEKWVEMFRTGKVTC